MRFTPTGPDISIEPTKARLANYQEHQTEQGFSRWIVSIVTWAVRLGIRDCSRCRNTVGIDLGFRLAQPYGGQRLAAEAARACVLGFAPSFDDFHIELWSHALGGNRMTAPSLHRWGLNFSG